MGGRLKPRDPAANVAQLGLEFKISVLPHIHEMLIGARGGRRIAPSFRQLADPAPRSRQVEFIHGRVLFRVALRGLRKALVERECRIGIPAPVPCGGSANRQAMQNFPWLVVEPGGQTNAGDWSDTDAARLNALVTRAHAQNLWIRFATLDGFLNGDGDGLTTSYNFGSDAAVTLRRRATLEAGADFIATDHYERFDSARRER